MKFPVKKMEETFSVLVNSGNGGFQIPDDIKRLYDDQRRKKEPSYEGICPFTDKISDRTDPYLIYLFEKYFLENRYIVIQKFPLKYKDFFGIEQYDGDETIVLLEDKFELHKLRVEAQKMRDCFIKIKNIFDLNPNIVSTGTQILLAKDLIDVLHLDVDLHKR